MKPDPFFVDICYQLQNIVKPELSSLAGHGVVDMACALLTAYQARLLLQDSPARSETDSSIDSIIAAYRESCGEYQQQLALLSQIKPNIVSLASEELDSKLLNFLQQQFDSSIDGFRSFTKLAGGFSKETYVFSLDKQNAIDGVSDLILRMDVKAGPKDFSVIDEFPFVNRAFENGIPVAKPIYCQNDGTVLGQPFVIYEKVTGAPSEPGDTSVEGWGKSTELRRKLGISLAKTLATIHKIPVPESLLVDADLRTYFQGWQDKLFSYLPEPEPALVYAFEWLITNIPSQPQSYVLVHGDYAPYNILRHNDTISAVLDWEFIHAGDPSEDLNYCRPYAESLIGWDDFLAAYRDNGGSHYNEQSAPFYEAWRDLRNVVCLVQGYHGYKTRQNTDIKSLFAYRQYKDYFLINALDVIQRN